MVEFVTSNDFRVLRTISNHLHFSIERNHSHLPLVSSLLHVGELGLNSGLYTLDPRDISDFLLLGVQELITTIRVLHEVFVV